MAIKIDDVAILTDLGNQTTTIGKSFKIEVSIIHNDWAYIKENYQSWQDVKDSFKDWDGVMRI